MTPCLHLSRSFQMPFSESQKGIPYASPNTKVTHLTGVKHKCNTLNRGCCLNNLREAETVFKSYQQLHKDHENSSSVDANRASEIRTPSSSELRPSGPYGSGSAEHTSTVVTGKHSPTLASDMHVIRSLTHTRSHTHICTHRNSEHTYT